MAEIKNAKVSPSVPILRNKSERFLVGQPAHSIPGSKLPTGRDVLKFLFHVNENCSDRYAAYKITVQNVMSFWSMARIKTTLPRNCVRKLDALWKEWRELKKSRGRKSDVGDQRAKFTSKINKLFDIGAEDPIDEIRNSRLLGNAEKEEDIRFYIDQRSERQGTMSGNDKSFKRRLEQSESRQKRQDSMRLSHGCGASTSQGQTISEHVTDAEEDAMDLADDYTILLCRDDKSTINILIPYQFTCPETS